MKTIMTYEYIMGKRFNIHINATPHFKMIVDNVDDVREEIYQFLYAITRNHRHALNNLDIYFVVADKNYYQLETEELYIERIEKNGKAYMNPVTIDIVSTLIHVPFVPEIEEGETKSALNIHVDALTND